MLKRKGFTLIELMVVILIVAILAAVAIPIMRGRIDAAKWSEGRAIMGTIATCLRAHVAEHDPNDLTLVATYSLTQLGFADGDCDGTYFADEDFGAIAIVDAQPLQFMITCTPGTRSSAPATPDILYLSELGFSGTAPH